MNIKARHTNVQTKAGETRYKYLEQHLLGRRVTGSTFHNKSHTCEC